MKPLSFIVFILIFFCCSDSDSEDPTTDGPARFSVVGLGDFPGAHRRKAGGFVINGTAYICGGITGWIGGASHGDRDFTELWEYTPGSDTWVRKPDHPLYFFPMVIEDIVYYFDRDLSLSTYDVTTGTSTKRTDFPGTDRSLFGLMLIGGKIYMGGSPTFDWWEYDPSANEWHQKSDVPFKGRYLGFTWSISNRGYSAFGFTSDLYFYDDFWEYDPAKDSWTEKGAKGLTNSMFFERVVFSRTIGDKPTMFLGNKPDILHVYQYDFDAEEWKVEYEWENKYNGGMAGFSIGSSHYFLFGQTTEYQFGQSTANSGSSNQVVVFKE